MSHKTSCFGETLTRNNNTFTHHALVLVKAALLLKLVLFLATGFSINHDAFNLPKNPGTFYILYEGISLNTPLVPKARILITHTVPMWPGKVWMPRRLSEGSKSFSCSTLLNWFKFKRWCLFNPKSQPSYVILTFWSLGTSLAPLKSLTLWFISWHILNVLVFWKD